MSTRTNRIAVFADLHYTCGSATLKGRVLREALDAALSLGASGIVCAGDMLGIGTVAEATALRALFDAQPLPVWFTPGNAELRTPSESAAANAILSNRSPLPDGVILIDSSAGYPSQCRMQNAECRMRNAECSMHNAQCTMLNAQCAMRRANRQTVKPSNCAGRDMGDSEKRKLLAVTHVPPNGGAIGLTVAGHLHIDDVRENGACRVLRGLDPDKAIGGPPAFATFVRDESGVWHFEANHEITGVRPAEWTPAFRDAFLADLGLSTMYDPFGGLAFATAEHVPCVELRHASWGDDMRALVEAIARWRESGGRVLSMHLPSLRFANGVAENVDAIAKSCETALALGCNRVTLHVPKMKTDVIASQHDAITSIYARALAPLAGTGVAIGIENMHMTPGETPDDRHYGYTPDECRMFIDALRVLSGLNIGFHLDIGHARNNAPYSSLFPVGTWYEQLGTECNGMHIHQVVQDEQGKMHNHKPLLGFFDKLIAISSLILARRSGLLPPVPMFIEVRDGLGPESLLALRAAISRQI